MVPPMFAVALLVSGRIGGYGLKCLNSTKIFSSLAMLASISSTTQYSNTGELIVLLFVKILQFAELYGNARLPIQFRRPLNAFGFQRNTLYVAENNVLKRHHMGCAPLNGEPRSYDQTDSNYRVNEN